MYMLERHYEELTKGLPDRTQLQAVNITNAAAWFFDDTKNIIVKPFALEIPDKIFAWKWDSDFPAVIPPFPVTWMEYKIPKWIGDIVDADDAFTEVGNNTDTMGYLIRAEPLQHEGGWLITWESWRMLNARLERQEHKTGYWGRWFNALEGSLHPSWKMTAECTRQGELITDSILYEFVDEDGEYYVETEATIEQKRQDTDETDNFIFGDGNWLYGYEIWGTFHPVLFATSLMHAKNVHLVDSPLPPAVAKRRRREGKPAVTFKTLTIESMRKQAATAAEGGSTDAKRAMHIVRGHFKDYRNSGGLFGKHKGLYWWDMHVAGDEQAGKVIKDYRI